VSHALSLHVSPWHLLSNWEEKHRKNLSQGSWKVPGGNNLMCWHGCLLEVARTSCPSQYPCSRGLESTLGQRRCLPPSCVTKGFCPSADFELNHSVRDLMWLVKKGTPKSSWICLLPMYQDESVATQRHLDWSTGSYLIWKQVADLQKGHTKCVCVCVCVRERERDQVQQ